MPIELNSAELEHRGFTVVRNAMPAALVAQLRAYLDDSAVLQQERLRAEGETDLPHLYQMRHGLCGGQNLGRDAKLMARVLATGPGLAIACAALKARDIRELRMLEQVSA
jgi:hypothetical protein